MEKVKKPNPSDFGLNEEEIIRFKRYQKKFEWSCTLGFPIIPAIFFVIYSNLGWGYVPVLWLAFIWFGAPIGIGLYLILERIFFPRQARYLAAVEKYDKWFIRTQKD
jgi:hypothetical protein